VLRLAGVQAASELTAEVATGRVHFRYRNAFLLYTRDVFTAVFLTGNHLMNSDHYETPRLK
jgi:hypothetical protein